MSHEVDFELHWALECALSRHFGASRQISIRARRPSPYATSHALDELDVRLDDGTALEILFKDLSLKALTETARRAKPEFLYDPLREIVAYEALLTPELGTPIYYGSVHSRADRYWLFLERVQGLELYQVGDIETWEAAARWLAACHSRFATRPDTMAGPVARRLLTYDREFYARWLLRALAFAGRAGNDQAKRERAGLCWLAERHNRVIEYLLALPLTLIHGEFYASNVLVQQTSTGTRVCPVDWEMVAIGPGLIDLAALSAGRWPESTKATLAKAYHAALGGSGCRPPSLEALLEGLDYCQLQLAVQWLGWSADWSPPPEHSQDWLARALDLAEKLRI